jgi:hypothetical protein
MEETNGPRREQRPSNLAHTHTVWAYQRTGRKSGRMVECGSGRIDTDRNIAHVVMNRQPLGGYTGYIVLAPKGAAPQPPQAARSDESDENSDD